MTDSDLGSALIYNNGKVYLSSIPNDKRTIGFLGTIVGGRTSNTDVSYNQIAYCISIGDSKEFKPQGDFDADGNIISTRVEIIKGTMVCNENGNIETGDFLTTSSRKGYFMKQNDDLVHNYTAARCMEDIVFDASGIKTDVYCIMMCG